MIKLLIADDEAFTVRMLQNLLDWESLGIQIVDTASNGEEAYEKIMKWMPDIVLSDIRMPVMSGLELEAQVNRVSDKIKFIIMSAYAEVEYLKEAMKLGCCDYIIKPIDEYELEDTLRRVILKIEGENDRERQMLRSNEQLEQLRLYHFMKSGQRWKKGKLPPLGEWLNREAYTVFLIKISSDSINEYVVTSQMELSRAGYLSGLLRNMLSERAQRLLFFDYEEGSWIGILNLSTVEEKADTAKSIKKKLEEDMELHVHICFGETGRGLEALPELYEEVQNLSRYCFYVGETDILGYGYNCDKRELDEVHQIDRMKGRSGEPHRKSNSRLVEEGIEILEKRYQENLSLEDICTQIAVSKNYFCYLFKREMGMSLWNYLTEIRIRHARELLTQTDLKSYEVAFQVGYDNPSYFSKLFKKHENMSPNEYRERRKKRAETEEV